MLSSFKGVKFGVKWYYNTYNFCMEFFFWYTCVCVFVCLFVCLFIENYWGGDGIWIWSYIFKRRWNEPSL